MGSGRSPRFSSYPPTANITRSPFVGAEEGRRADAAVAVAAAAVGSSRGKGDRPLLLL